MDQLFIRLALVPLALVVAWLPYWWVTGRLEPAPARPDKPGPARPPAGTKTGPDPRPTGAAFDGAVRGIFSCGLALIGYVTVVNLLGRLLHDAVIAALCYLALCVATCGVLWWRRAPARARAPRAGTWRLWMLPLLAAVILALPQWLLGVSTNYWDESPSSAIHLTAANQFAEGIFPPRHNAFPDVPIRYHYGFTLLSGSTKWLTGLSANISIDLVSTGLWLFSFLFLFFWLARLGLGRGAAMWGGTAVLLGGGLSWLYVPWLEAYTSYSRVPEAAQLVHRYDPAAGWVANLLTIVRRQSFYLRTGPDSVSSLPLEITNYFQQHAVALGLALTLVAVYAFVTWQRRRDFSPAWLSTSVVCFGTLFLAHGAFAAAAAVSAGLYLLGGWLSEPSRLRFWNGWAFTAGVTAIAFAHGGLLSADPAFHEAARGLVLRASLGYHNGGLGTFIHWNLAGFGLPLVMAAGALLARLVVRSRGATDSDPLFSFLAVFAAISYLAPHLAFYPYGSGNVEEATEVSKFFMCTRFALGVLSAFAVPPLMRLIHRAALVPAFVVLIATPLAICYGGAFSTEHRWNGFYVSPYAHAGGQIEVAMAEALMRLKTDEPEVFFDASADERRTGFLSSLLIDCGTCFTLTPSRYERTGAYGLSSHMVAERYRLNGDMARLRPGAPEASETRWLYARPLADMVHAPLIVRTRFAKLVEDGYVTRVAEAGPRALFAVEAPTRDLDEGIELRWQPKIITQARTDWDGDGRDDLLFVDYVNDEILIGASRVRLPERLARDALPHLYVATFPGDGRVDLLLGRLGDTHYERGQRITSIVERSDYRWTYRDSRDGAWQPEYRRWLWDLDFPIVADLDGDGFAEHLSYRVPTGRWELAPGRPLDGPSLAADQLPLPFAGRFFPDSAGELAVWGLRTGDIVLQSVGSQTSHSFRWGGREGDVLVPGDYDGDGIDEIAVWQRTNATWYTFRPAEGIPPAPEGIFQSTFGTVTGIPMPADYDHDGRLDFAYWEPAAAEIYVSFDGGASVGLTLPVPPHSVPAFVNMY